MRAKFKCTDPEWLCGDGSGVWPIACQLSGAPTFCAISVYFQIEDGKLFLVFSQVEFLEGAFTKLREKGVITDEELTRPLKELDSKVFALDYLLEECDSNPLLTSIPYGLC